MFRSTDVGAQWTLVDNGLMDRTISAVALRLKTQCLLERTTVSIDLIQGTWERLLEDISGSIYSLAVAEGQAVC